MIMIMIVIVIVIVIMIMIIIIIVSITKFSIVIGSPRAYLSRNRRAITWVSDYWGTYHLHGETENFSCKIKWFAPFRLERFRKYGL